MFEYIGDCVHVLRQTYPGITEEEILERDMDWIGDSMRRVARDRSRQRREDFADTLTAVNLAWSGGDTAQVHIKAYLDSLLTPEEWEAMDAAEQEAMRRQTQRRAEQLMRMFESERQVKRRGIGGTQDQQSAMSDWKATQAGKG